MPPRSRNDYEAKVVELRTRVGDLRKRRYGLIDLAVSQTLDRIEELLARLAAELEEARNRSLIDGAKLDRVDEILTDVNNVFQTVARRLEGLDPP